MNNYNVPAKSVLSLPWQFSDSANTWEVEVGYFDLEEHGDCFPHCNSKNNFYRTRSLVKQGDDGLGSVRPSVCQSTITQNRLRVQIPRSKEQRRVIISQGCLSVFRITIRADAVDLLLIILPRFVSSLSVFSTERPSDVHDIYTRNSPKTVWIIGRLLTFL